MNSISGLQLSLGDLIYAVKKRWKMIAILTIAGLVVGIVMSGVTYLQGAMSRNYEIDSSFVLTAQGKKNEFSRGANPDRSDFLMAQDMADTVRYILRSDKTMKQVISSLNLIGITERDISGNLRISQYNETPVIEMTLTWRSSEEGMSIMNALLDSATKILQETLQTGKITVISEPSARYIMGGSMNIPTWGIVAVLGMMAGIGAAALDVLLRPTLIDVKDVQKEFSLETLGIIPKDDEYFKNENVLLGQEGGHSTVRQGYSAAAHILKNRLGNKKEHHQFYVTSSIQGEGKTSAAANLAVQLADMENRVLLIDLDIKNPELGGRFLDNIDLDHSLNALYRGDISEQEAITSISGFLDILPTVLEHTTIPIDNAILELVNRLSANYDYVIMDAPPVGQVSDTLSLNEIADSALLVIGYDMAQKSEIAEAIDKLDKSGIKLVGCIVNQEKAIESINLFGQDATKNSKKKKEKKERDTSALTNEEAVPAKKQVKKEKQKRDEVQAKEKTDKADLPERNLLEEMWKEDHDETLSDEDAAKALLELGLKEIDHV